MKVLGCCCLVVAAASAVELGPDDTLPNLLVMKGYVEDQLSQLEEKIATVRHMGGGAEAAPPPAESAHITAQGGDAQALARPEDLADDDEAAMLDPIDAEQAAGWDKKASPMMPWDDIDKFEPAGKVIEEEDIYKSNEDTDTSKSFMGMAAWDNSRASKELMRASKVIGDWSGDADNLKFDAAKQALKHCADLTEKGGRDEL